MTAVQQTSTARLTAEQVEFFRREGYLKFTDPVFPAEKFEALRRHFDEKLARLPADVRPESMDVPHFTDTKLFEWLFADEVLNIVEPILGPDIALFSSHFICKPKGNGKRVPWHEDSAYWKGMLTPMEVVTVWLAIDPSLPENGCMKVIPRTLGGYSEYDDVDMATHVFSREIKKHLRDESKAVSLVLQPNQASLHDGRLMHASDPNTSNVRRCGYTMRYISARTRLNRAAEHRHHQIYLARGRDRAGNEYADPTKAYESLARYREKSGKGGH